MELTVNGDLVEVRSPRLVELLEELGYDQKKVVVAVNETFVPKGSWVEHRVDPNDRVEILSAMQGG